MKIENKINKNKNEANLLINKLTSFLFFVVVVRFVFLFVFRVHFWGLVWVLFWFCCLFFGGGFGLSIGNNFTNITIAPSGIYNFNDYFALGTGLQYSYLKEKNSYSSNVFGASLIGLFSPIEEIQLSLEVEQINVNNNYIDLGGNYNRNFWNTGLFVGGGYREGGITVGARLNLLFDSNKDIYGSAFMPFVRVFF